MLSKINICIKIICLIMLFILKKKGDGMKMLRIYVAVMSIFCVTCIYTQNLTNKNDEQYAQTNCDSEGGYYYFDRGGRRVFETSNDTYVRGTFNLRRGHVWRERFASSHDKRFHKMRSRKCCERCERKEAMLHEHFTGQEGLTRWPVAKGPKDGYARTKGYPIPQAPIWLRDSNDGYATPTSWQGFQ
jgi:hypothetical protein